MEFKEVIKNRYSCKKYSNRQVEKSALEAVLSAGRLAPTAKDLQEQQEPEEDSGSDLDHDLSVKKVGRPKSG